jgi:hypothetical protein
MEKGIFIKLTPIKTGVSQTGKEWASCQLIIDNTTNEKYKSIAVFDVFGDQKIDELQHLKSGDEIEVEYNINGFTYKDKNGIDVYSPKLNYWKHTVIQQFKTANLVASMPAVDDLPF